jgi:radical SAM protein with 4Fe4S-binding SPASM domain
MPHHARVLLGLLSRRQAFTGPRTLQLRVPAPCNHNCTFCVSELEPREARRESEARFDLERCHRLLTDAVALGTRRFNICSLGEPLLFPGLADLIAHVQNQSARQAQVTLVTNGTLLSRLGLDFIEQHRVGLWLSLHGGDLETWQRVHQIPERRAETEFRELRRALERLASSGRCSITLHNVVSRVNYDRLEQVVGFAIDTGVERLNLSALRGFAEQQPPAGDRDRLLESLRSLAERLHRHRIGHNLGAFAQEFAATNASTYFNSAGTGYYNRHRCYMGWLMTFVDVNGDVLPCCRARPLGNINATGFADIWRGPYSAFRRWSVRIPEVGPQPGYDCRNCSHLTLNDRANRLLRT